MHDVKNEVSVTGSRASFEFELLRKNEPCAVILEFEKEILALVDKFINSGQSGGLPRTWPLLFLVRLNPCACMIL